LRKISGRQQIAHTQHDQIREAAETGKKFFRINWARSCQISDAFGQIGNPLGE
jgi:hypothetical protein